MSVYELGLNYWLTRVVNNEQVIILEVAFFQGLIDFGLLCNDSAKRL